MGDSLWSSRFQPVMSEAITLLANLLGGILLDELFAKKLIEDHHYSELIDARRRESDEEVARKLYIVLRRKPEPSFTVFCNVLLKISGGGRDLYDCLRSTSSSSPNDEEVTVFVDITKELKERYELHEDSFITALEDYLRVAILQRVRIVKHFPPTLREQNTHRLEVAKIIQIKIFFPNIDRERFKKEEKDFVQYITRIMDIPEADLQLCIKNGSCIITMTVPGAAFIHLMRHIGVRGSLDGCGIVGVLHKIDAEALISFGTLPWATIGRLLRKVFIPSLHGAHSSAKSTVFSQHGIEKKYKEQDTSEEELLVVAIDIGTTYSGCAMSYKRDKYNIQCVLNWTDENDMSSKVPTALLLQPDGIFHSLGNEALLHYNIIDEEELNKWMYFSRFKMKFHKTANLSRHATVAAANGKELLAKRLFAVFLEHVKNDAIKRINTFVKRDISPQEIKWVITVPAIWNDKAKQIMREAAYEGGLASPRHSKRVVIALEPEAAALYCRALHNISPFTQDSEDTTLAFEPETRYLLADFGGGTVDVAVHEVQSDNRIRELHHATGGAWGGVYIDQNYVQLLERIFGEKMIEKFRSNHQRDWAEMILTSFESAKRTIMPERFLYLQLPFSFYRFMDDEGTSIKECINRFDNDDVRLRRGYLSLRYPEVKKLFEPVFSNIGAHLKGLLENHPGVKFMILVGGFASCGPLQTYLKTKFESSFGLRVIVPPNPSLSVMIGSVLFGHDSTLFASRRVKYSYGISVSLPFDKELDPESYRYVDDDGEVRCDHRFLVFAKTNDEVAVGKEIKRSIYPRHAHSTEMDVSVYTSTSATSRYTRDGGDAVKKATNVILPMPNTEKGRQRIAEVSMRFGETEIEVTSVDTSSGEKIEQNICLDFLDI